MPSVLPHEISPNIGNLKVGRGFMEIKRQGETSFVDCGNVTEATYNVKPTLLEHYSSRQGVRTKDLVVVTQLAATLTLIMEEFTARNIAFSVLGDFAESPPGTYIVTALSTPLLYCALKFTDTSVVGPQWAINFPLVILTPSKAVQMISAGSGAWGTFDFQADVLKDPDTGQFFTLEATDIESP